MTKIVTFLGNATFLKEIIEKNRLTDIYIDKSYIYINLNATNVYIDRLYVQVFIKPTEIELMYKDKVTYHFVDTGIKPNSKQDNLAYPSVEDQYIIEMINRRVRIAKMLRVILDQTDDDIMFIDSDIVIDNIEDVIDKLRKTGKPTTVCIPVVAKPYEVIVDYCYSTNFYLPITWKSKLQSILETYIKDSLYISNPVGVFIHRLMSSEKMQIEGVYHHIGSLNECKYIVT